MCVCSSGKPLWLVPLESIESQAVLLPDLQGDTVPDLLVATLPADQVGSPSSPLYTHLSPLDPPGGSLLSSGSVQTFGTWVVLVDQVISRSSVVCMTHSAVWLYTDLYFLSKTTIKYLIAYESAMFIRQSQEIIRTRASHNGNDENHVTVTVLFCGVYPRYQTSRSPCCQG